MTQNPQMKKLMAFSSKHILLALLAEDQSQEQGISNPLSNISGLEVLFGK
jgi:hypothetical protein